MRWILVALLVTVMLASNGPDASAAEYGTLVIRWAGVINNGEGDGTHGPYGRLHIRIYEPYVDCPGQSRSYPTGLNPADLVLPGPWVPGTEWLDGDAVPIDDLAIFRWRSSADAVIVFVYESDPSKGFGAISGRAHDPVFCALVRRNETLTSAVASDPSHPAPDDAILNCRAKGITWHVGYWPDGLNRGIPSVFIQFATTGQTIRRRSSATAGFRNVWADHNVWDGSRRGMRLHFAFDISGHRGRDGQVAAYFSFSCGSDLKDFDNSFNTPSGQVAVSDEFVPRYDDAEFGDFTLFMPYSQLHLASGSHDLQMHAQIWDLSTAPATLLATCEPFFFTVSD